jgi:putative FmdB family regulatory protein
MPMYDYICDKCGKAFDEKRSFDDSHADGICPHCGEEYDGKKAKQINKHFKTIYAQYGLKGHMGNH